MEQSVLIVGSWVTTTYELPLFQALQSYSKVSKFEWCKYLSFEPLSNRLNTDGSLLHSVWHRFQNKYIVGPAIKKLNTALITQVRNEKPDLIFLFRATHIWPETVKELGEYSKVFVYNNDDPFTKKLPSYVYKYFTPSLKYADWIFSYRKKNLDDYEKLGFKNTSVLRSNYLKDKHFPIENINKENDIVFIGHFENDGRDLMIESLIKKFGKGIRIWGNGWQKSPLYETFKAHMGQEIVPLFGESYNKEINSSKIALVFLSKINSDQYTRRCFEIPATKTLMLCEYAEEISTLFEEGVEAEYFRDEAELLSKAELYLKDLTLLNKVAEAGYRRVLSDGHEIHDRAKEIIDQYKKM